MTAPRFARGTKSRLFLYLGIAVVLFITGCVFHETQTRMDDVKKNAEKCQRQQESLAAQLQVIFEYKLRLEKSVQQEKADHRHTREELQSQLEEERARRAKEVLEATNKLASLQQHYKLLQGQHEDLDEDCKKARSLKDDEIDQYKVEILKLKAENEKLLRQAKEAVNQGRQAATLASSLKAKNEALENKLIKANHNLAQCTGKVSTAGQAPPAAPPQGSSSAVALAANDLQSVLHQPNVQYKLSSASSTAMQATNTSKARSNSQAAPIPVPGPPQIDNVGAKPVVNKESLASLHGRVQKIPAGVVPAPNVYPHDPPNYGDVPQGLLGQFGRLQNYRRSPEDRRFEESHQIAQPLLPNFGHLPRDSAFEGAHARDPMDGHLKAIAANEGGKMWKAEEEEVGGDLMRAYHQQDSYKEELDERKHGMNERGDNDHERGDDHERAPGDQHDELQLEDVEDDDEDDVDQIDYGNDNGVHKAAKRIPVGGKHESVMVNPK